MTSGSVPPAPAHDSSAGPAPVPRVRVAAYVIRRRATPELLVFDHAGAPEAGTQVPAGGVRPGEGFVEAVLREVAEETGLTDAAVVRRIALDDSPHPTTGRPRRTTFFHLEAGHGTPDAWTHTVRGEGDDSGLEFACRFVPLPLAGPLADGQDIWISRMDLRS
ncbi:NUDIX domain-containing protein [Streptomyces sp. LN785]|uniref:NUDIX hydrolase n=1 Tax=Streptomyces sp. LN785 TaxID=3112983 RepID=UPI0037193F10